MEFPLLLARVVLAAIFAVAAATKLIDPAGSRKLGADFGLPVLLAGLVGRILPLGELSVAVLLLPARSAWWGSVCALGLLVAFTGAIAWNLALGRTPDCHCFGQVRTKPIGWATLARNAVLITLAGFVTWGGTAAQLSVAEWANGLSGAQDLALAVAVTAVAVIAGQTWFVFHLFKQHGRLLLRLDEFEKRLGAVPSVLQRPQPTPRQGLPLGAPAPRFELPTIAGQSLALEDLHAEGKPAVLIFSDPNCGPCLALLPQIERWQRDYGEKVRIAVVSGGTTKANRAEFKRHGVRDVLLQQGREVAELYQATGTPAGVLVRADGAIGSRVVAGSEAIANLVALASGVPLTANESGNGNGRANVLPTPLTAHSGLAIGQKPPSVRLPDLTGRAVSLAHFQGRKILVMFWNPGCGFCQQMLPVLKVWEQTPPDGAPDLLVVSTGTVEANRQMGLRSPVLLDSDFSVARQFGANGTPSAVLINREGRIASELGVGALQVMALADAPQHVKHVGTHRGPPEAVPVQ